MQHAIIRALFHNKNYFAPLKSKKPKRMLDIGCGTGAWCSEMGMFMLFRALLQLLTIGSTRLSKV
jgi:precorrin-6B methylase 2